MESDIFIFLGRFHPVVVHLPIGFLLLAMIFQLVEYLLHKDIPILEQAIKYGLLLGAITAFLAVSSGWILAENSRYSSTTLDWHRWGGVAVMVFAFLTWGLKTRLVRVKPLYYKSCLTILTIALMATGHWGGSLTHGNDYLLEHAPTFIRHLLLPAPDTTVVNPLPDNPDSVKVYADLIHPILKNKCYSCHNSDENNGNLDMTSEEALINGGDEGNVLVRGNAFESGLFQRVTLPIDHPKYMPPKGDPLTFQEIRILEWWINQGGTFNATLSELDVPKDLSLLFLEEFNLDMRPRPFYETSKIKPASDQAIASIRASGYQVSELSEKNHYLRLSSDTGINEQENLESLLAVPEHVVFLDLSGAQVPDESMDEIGQLQNLYHLDLSNTSVTNDGLIHLNSLNRLAVLNLYGTTVSDEGLEHIKLLPALKKVYLWQTETTQEFMDQWKKENPDLEVVGGE